MDGWREGGSERDRRSKEKRETEDTSDGGCTSRPKESPLKEQESEEGEHDTTPGGSTKQRKTNSETWAHPVWWHRTHRLRVPSLKTSIRSFTAWHSTTRRFSTKNPCDWLSRICPTGPLPIRNKQKHSNGPCHVTGILMCTEGAVRRQRVIRGGGKWVGGGQEEEGRVSGWVGA
eukprot:3941291-Rhodomonas_salina.1